MHHSYVFVSSSQRPLTLASGALTHSASQRVRTVCPVASQCKTSASKSKWSKVNPKHNNTTTCASKTARQHDSKKSIFVVKVNVKVLTSLYSSQKLFIDQLLTAPARILAGVLTFGSLWVASITVVYMHSHLHAYTRMITVININECIRQRNPSVTVQVTFYK